MANRPPAEGASGAQETETPWASRTVLSLDGGGVRGYFSLLLLQRLMDYIRLEETKISAEEGDSPLVTSSYAPCEPLEHASHLAEINRPVGAKDYDKFLPCHYFDYICGTSTGGLITIMLARLRMPVEDCLHEYRTLAGKVFGYPRRFHAFGALGLAKVTSRTKYDTSKLEDTIKDVVSRRGEDVPDQYDSLRFETEPGLCRAFVLAEILHILGPERIGVGPERVNLHYPFVMRSYNNLTRSPGQPSPVSRQEPLNPGKATVFPAWKVGRATTAADLFFEPLEISLSDGSIVRRRPTGLSRQGTSNLSGRANRQENQQRGARRIVQLTDAGLGRVNNPSREALRELRSMLRSHQRIGVFVSVGTARPRQPTHREATLMRVIKRGIEIAGDPNDAHEYVRAEASRDDGFDYYRFNQEDGLVGMEMDEWLPRGSGNGSGERTIEKMVNAFNAWAAHAENVGHLQKCAKALVQLRRARSRNQARWERFAVGRFYMCPEPHCPSDTDTMWHHRGEFEEHLRTEHREAQPSADEYFAGQWRYKPPQP